MLAVLEVPGLAEGRPQLVIGDVVFLRMAAPLNPSAEYRCEVAWFEAERVFLAAPSAWV
jgi:hypothetical protein